MATKKPRTTGSSNKIVSLNARRASSNQKSRKESLDTEARLRELEEDVLRLIDSVVQIGKDSDRNYSIIRKILRLLRNSASSSRKLPR